VREFGLGDEAAAPLWLKAAGETAFRSVDTSRILGRSRPAQSVSARVTPSPSGSLTSSSTASGSSCSHLASASAAVVTCARTRYPRSASISAAARPKPGSSSTIRTDVGIPSALERRLTPGEHRASVARAPSGYPHARNSALQILERREHPAMILGQNPQLKLVEDAGHVALDRAHRYHQVLGRCPRLTVPPPSGRGHLAPVASGHPAGRRCEAARSLIEPRRDRAPSHRGPRAGPHR
jgi:hypothetical protein